MPAAERPTIEYTTFSKRVSRMWGFDLDSWNSLLLLSLAITALAAFAVVVATTAVMRLQRAAELATKEEFERYKLEAGEKISAANAVGDTAKAAAAEANLARLKLEEKLAPRRLSNEQQNTLAASLEQFMGRKIRIESYSLDVEGEILAQQIGGAIALIFTIDDWVGSERGSTGFAKGINVTGSNVSLVAKLVESLENAGLREISTVPLPPQAQSFLLLENSRTKAADVEAVILVGVKPLSP
jgi:hypothetical protein